MRDRWQACCGIVRVVLLGWLVRLAFFGVAMKGAVATVDMPRIFRGGGGTSERATGGWAVVLIVLGRDDEDNGRAVALLGWESGNRPDMALTGWC